MSKGVSIVSFFMVRYSISFVFSADCKIEKFQEEESSHPSLPSVKLTISSDAPLLTSDAEIDQYVCQAIEAIVKSGKQAKLLLLGAKGFQYPVKHQPRIRLNPADATVIRIAPNSDPARLRRKEFAALQAIVAILRR